MSFLFTEELITFLFSFLIKQSEQVIFGDRLLDGLHIFLYYYTFKLPYHIFNSL